MPEQPSAGRADLPTIQRAQALAEWLQGPRSRALRRAGIGLRESVLEIGAGHCVVTPELQRRARGEVVSIDIVAEPFVSTVPPGTAAVIADAARLPFPENSFDLVFSQNTLMWVSRLEDPISEAARTLATGGVLVAIEPDYGGMMEHPDLGLRQLWTDGLSRAGAEPLIGRMLPSLCEQARLDVWVELAHIPQSAETDAVELLDDLPLTVDEHARVDEARAKIASSSSVWSHFIHVPYFLIVAEKR
jgi:SAM-dependent methyltransferase